ncbi:hypothetical protein V6N13_025323 [Hibiscus sabdariffa]
MTNFSPRISEDDLRSPRASPLRDPFPPLNGTTNGRPSDGSLQSVLPSRLERLAEPVSVEDQQVGKRSCGEGDDVMDVDLDIVGGTVPLAVGYKDSVCDVSGIQQSEERSQVKPSFRDMLAGNKPLNFSGKYGHTMEACKKGETNSGAGAQADVCDLMSAGPDEKFGPRMQAPSRRSRKLSKVDSSSALGTLRRSKDMSEHGMFDILSTLDQEVEPHEIGLNQKNVSSHDITVINDVAQDEAPSRGNGLKIPVEGETVGRSALHEAGSHSSASKVVEIGPMGHSECTTRRGVAGKHLVATSSKSRLAGGKSGVWKGSSIRKKQDPRSASKVVLGEWLGHMEQDLDRSKDRGEELAIIRDGESKAVDSAVLWRENTVEANGLSGGIWVLWRHSVSLDVHARCTDIPVDIAWLLGGDFNSILSSDEHMGGSARRNAVCSKFGDFMWWSTWPNATLLHLIRIGSDHRPILLHTAPSSRPIRRSSFRYLAAWQSHTEFEGMLASSWKLGEPIVRNIANFQRIASNWNREYFGNIGRRKHRLLARIRGIESAAELSTGMSLQNLEISLKQELAEVLKQEESLWFQRSRAEWILDGDRNGQWCLDPLLIREEVVTYFKEVFRSTAVSNWTVRGRFATLTSVDETALLMTIQDEEVRSAVFAMSPLKSSGLDGVGS